MSFIANYWLTIPMLLVTFLVGLFIAVLIAGAMTPGSPFVIAVLGVFYAALTFMALQSGQPKFMLFIVAMMAGSALAFGVDFFGTAGMRV